MKKIIMQNEGIRKLCDGHWVQLAILDAKSSELKFYRDGGFENHKPQTGDLAKASGSVDWYRGWRDHLKFASVGQEFGA